MRRKVYGARQDAAWRQSVKDYSPSGRVLIRERRRKATLSIIQDSEAAPSGWSYITVGERWNGRGKYVDLFLSELAASPVEREARWGVEYGDNTDVQQLNAISIKLSEHRFVQRDKLQYSVNVVLDYYGMAETIVRQQLREYAPGWYDTTVCRTEESRELAWNTLKLACERVGAWLRRHLVEWKAQKERMLSLLRLCGETVTVEKIYDDLAIGAVADSDERFIVYWSIHSDIEKPPAWTMYALPGDGSHQGSTIESAASDPLQARLQIASFLSHLNVTRPAAFGGRRRIVE